MKAFSCVTRLAPAGGARAAGSPRTRFLGHVAAAAAAPLPPRIPLDPPGSPWIPRICFTLNCPPMFDSEWTVTVKRSAWSRMGRGGRPAPL